MFGFEVEAASSSDRASGAARFFPLVSLGSSLIVIPAVAGNVERRPLSMFVSKYAKVVIGTHDYLLLARTKSSNVSFPFPLEESVSRERLTEVDDEDRVCSVKLRSLSFSLCLAALTLALERKTLGSVEEVDAGLERSSGCDADELVLMVASRGWVKSI